MLRRILLALLLAIPVSPRAVAVDVESTFRATNRWFVRGNNVVHDKDPGLSSPGVGYGDSYIIDPFGEMIVRSRRLKEDFIFIDADPAVNDRGWGVGRSMWSAREFGKFLTDAAAEKGK